MPVSRRGTWEEAFVDAIAAGASVREAAQKAGVSVATAFRRRSADPTGPFAAAWQQAAEIGPDPAEWELARRAYHGVLKPVWYRGQEVGAVREFSDSLLLAYLRARKPELYRDKADGGQVNLSLAVNVQAADVVRALLSSGSLSAADLIPLPPAARDQSPLDSGAEAGPSAPQ